MFQKIEFCITAHSITSQLENLTDKAYNFSLRLITHNNTYNSEHSEPFLNPAFQKVEETTDDKSSQKSYKNGKQKDNERSTTVNGNGGGGGGDENFGADINEDVEVVKIKSKQVKQSKEILDSPMVETMSPTKKKTLLLLNQSEFKRPSYGSQKANTDMRGSIKKLPGSSKLEEDQENPEASDVVNDNDELIAGQEKNSVNLEEQALEWGYDSQENNDEGPEPPELIVKLTTKDLATTSLQICFWGLSSTEPLEKIDEAGNVIKYFDNHIAGECYISLNRIFSIDPTMIEIKGQKVQVRKKAANEKLWNHGKEVGFTTSSFKVINHEYLQQMIVGVQTENGVYKASPAIYDFKEATQADNNYIKELNQAKNILNDSVFTLYEKKQILEQKEKDKIKKDINESFQKVFELAQKSHKESIKSFYYKSQEELLQSQDILIDIAKHLSQYADEVEEYLRDSYYECLKIIINRGEFDLNYMGFDEQYNTLLDTAKGAQFKKTGITKDAIKRLNLKMKVALSYQKLLYNILEKVLDKLTQKALSDKERQFVENYCAIAYFRIPEFRDKLLEIITKPDDVEITEWRGTEYQLDDKKNQKLIKNTEFMNLFDWEKGFYQFLRTQERGEQHFNDLQLILNDTKWSKRMSKRGVAYFFFLTEWLQYVNKTVVVKDHVPWQDLPGYLILLRTFLVELKSRDILQYPEAMKFTSQNILNNERLLNILITLIYNKTNVFDSNKTVQTFDLINSWMQFLANNNKNIPTVFDFSFFFKGMKMVLEQDHSICLARVIWVIYNNFQLFPPDFQKEICELLFSNLFFKLFMHWSYNVRMIFQYFLQYRIQHLFQEQKTKYKGIDELKRQILNNANQSERKFALINDIIFLMYQRMMNIIDSARLKYASQETQFQEQQKIHLKMRQKLIEKQENKLFQRSEKNNSYSILEVSFSQEKERVQEVITNTQNILDDLQEEEESPGLKKNEPKQIEEKDMLYDDFENYEIQQIQKAQSTISQIKVHLKRSNSVQQDAQVFQKEDMQFEYMDNDPVKLQRSRSNSFNSNPLRNSISIQKTQGIIYNRRGFQNEEKKEEELIQMEKQYIKYIVQSCVEFEAIKKGYQKWYTQKANLLPSLPKDKKQILVRKFMIPEVILRATIDESETSYSQLDEW